MQYIVHQQIAVEAESPEEALEKARPVDGQRISFSVNLRPQPQQIIPSAPKS